MVEHLHAAEPTWQPSEINISRRLALVGLSGLVVSAMGVERAWAQGPRSCVLTPEAGEGPFYLDPKLLRSDITSGQPGAPLDLSMQVVRAGDCATLAGARVDVWHADALGLYSGYAKQSGVGGISTEPAVGKQYPERHSAHRCKRERAVPHDLPQLVRRPHTARSLQSLSHEQRSRREPDLLSRRHQQGSLCAVATVSAARVQAKHLQRQRPDQTGSLFRGCPAAWFLRGHRCSAHAILCA